MDQNLQEMVPNVAERPLVREGVSAGVAREARQVPHEGQDTEAMIKARTQAAEQAARSTQEMKDPELKKIESFLSDGLADEFAGLDSAQKDVFREEGEKLAVWLHDAFARNRVRPHEVLKHIEQWLLIIEDKNHRSDWLRQDAYIRARRALSIMMQNEQGH